MYGIYFSTSALLRRATVYFHMNNFQMAAEDLRMVLREEPCNAAATVGDRQFDGMPVAILSTRGDCIYVKLCTEKHNAVCVRYQ